MPMLDSQILSAGSDRPLRQLYRQYSGKVVLTATCLILVWPIDENELCKKDQIFLGQPGLVGLPITILFNAMDRVLNLT